MAQDSISLTLEPREITGKAVKHIRKDGKIPAVIHDHGKDSVIVQADSLQLNKIWQQAGKHHPIQLKTSDKSYTALIKSADFDPKKNQLRHVVFNAVDRNQKVDAEVPIRPRYSEDNEASPAERNGLIVLTQLDSLQIKATPDNLPDVLEYDAEKLVEIGDSITVADLSLPAGVETEVDETHSIATVYEPSALAAANEAAAGEAEEGEEPETEEGAEGEEGTSESGEGEAEGESKTESPEDVKPDDNKENK